MAGSYFAAAKSSALIQLLRSQPDSKGPMSGPNMKPLMPAAGKTAAFLLLLAFLAVSQVQAEPACTSGDCVRVAGDPAVPSGVDRKLLVARTLTGNNNGNGNGNGNWGNGNGNHNGNWNTGDWNGNYNGNNNWGSHNGNWNGNGNWGSGNGNDNGNYNNGRKLA